MAWRSQQWATFAKRWWIYDANKQCPMLSGEKLAIYLMGRHKPIFLKNGSLGDEVVVINSRRIAVKDNSMYWRRYLYSNNTRFGKYNIEQTMEETHKVDPTKVINREIRTHILNDNRQAVCERLHLFPDGLETVPQSLLANVSGVIRQVLPIHKRLDQYSAEEIENFPNIVRKSDSYSGTKYESLFEKLPADK